MFPISPSTDPARADRLSSAQEKASPPTFRTDHVSETNVMANFFHMAVTGICFTLQEIRATNYFDSLMFCSKCQYLLKSKQALQAEAFSTHQDYSRGRSAVPILAFGKSDSVQAERTVHAATLRLQLLFNKRKCVQLLILQRGVFPNCFMNSIFQVCSWFWSMEWPLDPRSF